MTDIVKTFEVSASPQHAFDVWTTRAGIWWPREHTMGGDDHAELVFHPDSGRIFERTKSGQELEWGSILEWAPPERIVYSWHLFFPPEEATTVTVTFDPVGENTMVRIEHTGFDALGAAGPPRQQRTDHIWDQMAKRCQAAIAAETA